VGLSLGSAIQGIWAMMPTWSYFADFFANADRTKSLQAREEE
jgi:hypothetical protein